MAKMKITVTNISKMSSLFCLHPFRFICHQHKCCQLNAWIWKIVAMNLNYFHKNEKLLWSAVNFYFRWKKCLNYIFVEMSSGERLIMWPKRMHASIRKCFNGPTPPFKMSYYKREFSVFFKEIYRHTRWYP